MAKHEFFRWLFFYGFLDAFLFISIKLQDIQIWRTEFDQGRSDRSVLLFQKGVWDLKVQCLPNCARVGSF